MLRELREKNKLTQKALSEKIKVRQSTVSMWEQKKAIPHLDKIERLAQVLNVTESDVIKCFK